MPVGCHRKKRKLSPCWLPLQQTENEGLAQNVILPNGLADLLGMELLELKNGQPMKDSTRLNQEGSA